MGRCYVLIGIRVSHYTTLHSTYVSAEELWLGHDVKGRRLDTRPPLRVAQRRAQVDLLGLLDTVDPHLN